MTRHGDLGAVERALGPLVRRGQSLGALTTYRVGGEASLFAECDDEEQLLAIGRALVGREVPVLVIGRGSNLLVADAGFRGLAISLGPGFDSLQIEGTDVVAGGALSLPVLARRTAAAGLHGLEWGVGVPGSVGGAIRMNAGGHGSDTAATLLRYRYVDLHGGGVQEADAGRLHFAYRHSDVSATEVVTAGTYRLERGDPAEAAATIAEIVRWRRANQPGGSNAGSVFTNPDGDSAGRLVESCGLKGRRVGTAEVSHRHANFIQSDADGSADDVARLIELVRTTVAAITGVVLETEVCMVGFAESERALR